MAVTGDTQSLDATAMLGGKVSRVAELSGRDGEGCWAQVRAGGAPRAWRGSRGGRRSGAQVWRRGAGAEPAAWVGVRPCPTRMSLLPHALVSEPPRTNGKFRIVPGRSVRPMPGCTRLFLQQRSSLESSGTFSLEELAVGHDSTEGLSSDGKHCFTPLACRQTCFRGFGPPVAPQGARGVRLPTQAAVLCGGEARCSWGSGWPAVWGTPVTTGLPVPQLSAPFPAPPPPVQCTGPLMYE